MSNFHLFWLHVQKRLRTPLDERLQLARRLHCGVLCRWLLGALRCYIRVRAGVQHLLEDPGDRSCAIHQDTSFD